MLHTGQAFGHVLSTQLKVGMRSMMAHLRIFLHFNNAQECAYVTLWMVSPAHCGTKHCLIFRPWETLTGILESHVLGQCQCPYCSCVPCAAKLQHIFKLLHLAHTPCLIAYPIQSFIASL